jgi:hypothetical protein
MEDRAARTTEAPVSAARRFERTNVVNPAMSTSPYGRPEICRLAPSQPALIPGRSPDAADGNTPVEITPPAIVSSERR